MKILYAAGEALPFAATGGLGDVMGSLPAAVKATLGDKADVRVVIPLYPSVRNGWNDKLERVFEGEMTLSWRRQYLGIYKIERSGVTFYFIDNEYYFKRAQAYGNFDDGERFAFFSKAVLELMRITDFYPDILHANDWQSALSVIYLKRKYAHLERYQRISALYTIHNIDYQGVFGFDILGDVFELDEWDRSIVDYSGNINLTKGAIVCADRVTTVSPRYSKEIMTEYYSAGLYHILRMYREKIIGIINGIDISYYDPKTDPDIASNYSADDMTGKAKNKAALEDICSFPHSDAPIVAMVSRLASHKGFELVRRVLEEIVCNSDIRFAVLGTGEAELEDFFRYMASRYPDRVCAMIEFNKALSKKIYAGADMFLMPSKSEPCGLSQMIASRYGTVAIVREIGGLADTIIPYNEFENTGNGFSFVNYNAHDMMNTVYYARTVYGDGEKWRSIVRRAMDTDFSWHSSAVKYIDLYTSMQY